jgi:hypothetical protein
LVWVNHLPEFDLLTSTGSLYCFKQAVVNGWFRRSRGWAGVLKSYLPDSFQYIPKTYKAGVDVIKTAKRDNKNITIACLVETSHATRMQKRFVMMPNKIATTLPIVPRLTKEPNINISNIRTTTENK